jgi:hypothetical protein
LVRIDVDFKSWLHAVPDVERARPGQCPWCGAAGRSVGGRPMLHGHGLRERQLRGPLEPGGEPQVLALLLRRYLCVACGAVITVAPGAVLPKRLFTAAAIAMALALWSVAGESSPKVRAQISPLKTMGDASARSWLTLRRWTRDARGLFRLVRPWPDGWPPRRGAERVATTLAALAPGSGTIAERAFAGAARAD